MAPGYGCPIWKSSNQTPTWIIIGHPRDQLLDFEATFEQLLEFWSNFWGTFLRKLEQLVDSPTPEARRAAKRSPIPIEETTHELILASGIARGRVRTTATVESRKMAATLQIIEYKI